MGKLSASAHSPEVPGNIVVPLMGETLLTYAPVSAAMVRGLTLQSPSHPPYPPVSSRRCPQNPKGVCPKVRPPVFMPSPQPIWFATAQWIPL
jgi:hypothetical protein